MKKLNRILAAALAAVVSISMVGCGNAKSAALTEEDAVLKLGLMPAVDAAPILIAEKNGYFKEAGITVEVEIYTNAQNRQSALVSNEIDGAITDFVALATNVNGGFDMKATTMTDGSFPLLSNEGVTEKEDIRVAMMEVSVTNYLVDKWLGEDYNIEKVFINEIPARLAALESGEIDMGIFPEPVASNGELQGFVKNIYGTDDEYSMECLVFTGKALEEKPNTIKAFHGAYNKAVDDINENPEIARDILIEHIPNTSPDVKDIMALPAYHKTALPSEEFIQEVIDWTADTMGKELDVKPADLIEEKFIK